MVYEPAMTCVAQENLCLKKSDRKDRNLVETLERLFDVLCITNAVARLDH
jgi:hypothetical protein